MGIHIPFQVGSCEIVDSTTMTMPCMSNELTGSRLSDDDVCHLGNERDRKL